MDQIFLEIIKFLYQILFQNLGLTVIALAILTRIVFFPFTKSQKKYAKKMQELKPKLDELSKKHKDDKVKLQQAQMDLYKEHGINPAAGCLPLIVQLVVFAFLYNALYKSFTLGLNTSFLFYDMSKPDIINLVVSGQKLAIPGLLVILASFTQFLQSRMMLPAPVPVNKDDKPKEKEQKEDLASSLNAAQGQMTYLFPLMFLFLGTKWPSGLALYWTVSTILAIIQQYYQSGLGGLEPLFKKFKK